VRRWRIGVVTTSYPRWEGDAAGRFVAEHAAVLRGMGCEVEVIAAGERRMGTGNGEWSTGDGARLTGNRQRATGNGQRVERVRSALFYRGAAPEDVWSGAVFVGRMAAVVARRQWDAVVAHWLPTAIAAMATRGPLLAIAHGSDVELLVRKRMMPAVAAALRMRRARVVFVSEDGREKAVRAAGPLARWLDGQAIVQGMGVEVDRFAGVGAGEARTIAVLARLVDIKGVDLAIEAMRSVRGRARLVIAGDGPEREKLARRAHGVARATGHAIELVGVKDPVEVLASARVVVVPSRRDGAPVAPIEALAAGRPVIATAVGGLNELPGVVRRVAVDPVALGRAIEQVIDHPPSAEDCRAAARPRAWSAVSSRLHQHWLGAQAVTQFAPK
jgi:glycosyltransferase involved in cell wall biosynthesis